MTVPTNIDDVIDSRDIIARIAELEGERQYLEVAATESQEVAEAAFGRREHPDGGYDIWLAAENTAKACATAVAAWDVGDDGQELAALGALASEAEDYAPDWQHGVTLISLEYWPAYAEAMIQDIGVLPKNLPDYIVIDWEATAGNLKVDYTEVEFDGVTYLVR